MELFINYNNNNYGIINLIETPKELCSVRFSISYDNTDETFCRILENALINHADTIQHFKINKQPITSILSSLRNLKCLELDDNFHDMRWDRLENLSLPLLEILRARAILVGVLTSLIENTIGHLVEIRIDHTHHGAINNKNIIKAIYQNCPNLKYLKLWLRNGNISEFENLLINCQYLNGLYILVREAGDTFEFCWNDLFKILTESSPAALFKFKFWFYDEVFELESLKLFFEGWKGRRPMFLQTIISNNDTFADMKSHFDLIEMYKAKGIIEKFDHDDNFEEFEWNHKMIISNYK